MKKAYGENYSFIELAYVVGAHWNCLSVYKQHVLLKLRKTILKYKFIKNHVN